MKKRFLAILLVVISVLCCMTACGKKDDDSTKPNPNPGYDVVEDNEAHYLIFMVEANEVEKMLVVSTDNYENLEPYFRQCRRKKVLSAIGKMLMKCILRHKKRSISMLIM